MKVKVLSDEFKKLATSVSPFAGGNIEPTSGMVGLTFTKACLIIRAFAGTWAWGEIDCRVDGYERDMNLVISDDGLKVALLYCDGDSMVLDVSDDRLLVGSATIKTMATRTVEDLTPNIDLSTASWIMLPEQAKRVVSASLTDRNSTHGQGANLHLDPDAIFCLTGDGVHASVFIVDWELDQRVIVPFDVAKVISSKGSGDISFCELRDLLVLAIDGLHVATPQVGGGGISDEFSSMLKGVWFPIAELGTVSASLITELDVADLQSDVPTICLWSRAEKGPDLYFHSPGSEVGSNSGSIWSNLKDFRVCVNPAFLKKLIPRYDMWRIGTISYKDGGEPVLLMEEESGVYHHLNSKSLLGGADHDELFQKIIDEHDYKE